jgi:hypothetical protein
LRLLGHFQAMQLAAHIDQDPGELRPHGSERTPDPFLGSNDVVAESGGITRAERRERSLGTRADQFAVT